MSQKTLILNLLAIVGIATGCSTSRSTRFGVQDHKSGEIMFVSAEGEKEWYSALELDRIARRYAAEHRLDFDFNGTDPTVWVNTGGRRVLANVYYSSGLGKPMLHVVIDRHGRAIRHNIAVAVCGTGSK